MLAVDLHRQFGHFADALEILGDSAFRARSYRRVAQIVLEVSDHDLETLSEKELIALPGIGESLAQKIIEYRQTGKIEAFAKTLQKIPTGLFELLKIPTLGPKSVHQMWQKLGITDQAGLLKAIESGRLVRLYGFGEKKVANIKKSLDFVKKSEKRVPFAEVWPVAESLLKKIRQVPGVLDAAIAGSLRRQAETIGDIDLVVSSRTPRRVIAAFVRLPEVVEVTARGTTKASVRLGPAARQADLRVVPPPSYGAALQYFTGNKQHNIELRNIAQKKGMKLSEYGLFKGRRRVAGATEAGIYRALGSPMPPPALRLGQGELES
jgi:DNA polymerase (family 10)